ncbi:hypothetical protein A2962_04570 [Candidatus Woesebacteria bacterium RIFCSPLOWO2_01_FULL_39_61]|uniref:Uncharacterized protein n=1 Tax=Candidatus Woesebacteria bacterium RIFCSPHIGHO2_02_FULL_39_13 TaxID=1802505 RepID=A0A1F7YX90_9BACT|nr:MAG: hypothetical protein A2692_05885 [Candidatus Woesebacteria bacterium RIFCSPHIGHO2_01_FULL_39_95]OGM31943.1 MAG: hypothetical protein A3D01_00740 [Candidatus Woesebacteria bacterium RIFCSPHIGHO2_02_FULL_39_13]OGM36507.1 MAG: hypothetical protein A3E13_02515 [Candidatus Woesebacteria bacterium RIFCSPHIGHO2_12_FULL_40_20]OGM65528.1 MAG: hypothetical protein A2962_04570 [Candidatus Woesebacteria bacterium RIFCSPLOWO2_01_FULL_39_61]OGM73193.1 MAG: hypothetical protein A3H19_02035 [Candidatus
MSDTLSSQLDEIQAALSSSKVDSFMLLEFEGLRQTMPAADLPRIPVAFLAQVSKGCPLLSGELARIGNIVAVTTTYSSIPGLVADPNVINLEASRNVATFESVAVVKPYSKLYYIGTAIMIATALLFIVLTVAEIRPGLWIFIPPVVGFTLQMYAWFKSRPRYPKI